MARVNVPQADGVITLFDGAELTTYKVAAGVIDVSDEHLASVLASVHGSELAPEAPAKGASAAGKASEPSAPETLAKEK